MLAPKSLTRLSLFDYVIHDKIYMLCYILSGTKKERGIAAWQIKSAAKETGSLDKKLQSTRNDVYLPLLPRRLLRHRIAKYIPFLPYLSE